jgi:F0F1-type ATP synthase epsilon subunit
MPIALLTLTVKNRDGIIFQGEITSLTSYNDKGKFDVLQKHANFISLIKKEIEYRLPNKEIKRIELDNGIIKVLNDRVDIYLGIGISPNV